MFGILFRASPGGASEGSMEGHAKEAHIKINSKEVVVPEGANTVAFLKQQGGVVAADELERFEKDKQLAPLADDATIEVKSGDKFVSQPRRGGSS